MKDGLLFRKFYRRDGTDDYFQFIVPQAMKENVLYQMHMSLFSGHLGCTKTLQRFYWFGLRDVISVPLIKRAR